MADDLRRDFLNCYLIQATLLLRSHGPRRSTGIESVVNSRPNFKKRNRATSSRPLAYDRSKQVWRSTYFPKHRSRSVCELSNRAVESLYRGGTIPANRGTCSNSRRPFQCFHINRPVVARCPDQELA